MKTALLLILALFSAHVAFATAQKGVEASAMLMEQPVCSSDA